jgi:hypothetical protein
VDDFVEREMDREQFDRLQSELKVRVGGLAHDRAFPLNAAVEAIVAQHQARFEMTRSRIQEQDLRLLELFDITSVSATFAIRAFSKKGDDTSGISGALVDLWTQSEAARCLWFDCFASSGQAKVGVEVEALRETAKLLAPEAIAVAIRMQEPVSQYVEFVSKVLVV